jgi:alkylhydroperoxidase family enzyme
MTKRMARLPYATIALKAYKHMGAFFDYIAKSEHGQEILNLVYLLLSQIHGCSYCGDLHWPDGINTGEDRNG